MAMWNPWRGCIKCSEGCKYCYIHKGDFKRNVNTNLIVKTKDFYKPIEKLKNGNYKMKSGLVYLCFSTDFLIEEADSWRKEIFSMIKERTDCTFLFLTKRIDRFLSVIPDDWGNGYDNVIVCSTIENQKNADYKLSVFNKLPIIHKCITAQPLLEDINIEPYLNDYDWVLDIREQCIRKNVKFEFRQCGTHFIKDGKMNYLKTMDLCKTAKSFNINYNPKVK